MNSTKKQGTIKARSLIFTNMKIAIKTKNLELTLPMKTYINQKIGTLEKFLVEVDKCEENIKRMCPKCESARHPILQEGGIERDRQETACKDHCRDQV